MIDLPFSQLKLQSMMPLGGGCMARAWKLTVESGKQYFCKYYQHSSSLDIAALEAKMLDYLDQNNVPVPKVIDQKDGFLLLEYIASDEALSKPSQQHLGEIIAKMHQISADQYGFFYDTCIGTLKQPNQQAANWVSFFRTHRLGYITQLLLSESKIQKGFFSRMMLFLDDLEKFLPQSPFASLLHGDLWTGNILCANRRVMALIDPALSYGHHEQDLAYSTLFGTTDKVFFQTYGAITPIDQEFWQCRKDIYNLWPILCHAYWFGSSYIGDASRIISRLGY